LFKEYGINVILEQPSNDKNRTRRVFMPPFYETENPQSSKEPLISMQSVHYYYAPNFNILNVTDTWE
jgi:hypothetical protein